MCMMKRMRITTGGQVSIPSPVRRRWNTSAVFFEDHGEYALLRPAPDDPVAAAAGAFAAELRGIDLAAVRRDERAAERHAERG